MLAKKCESKFLVIWLPRDLSPAAARSVASKMAILNSTC